MIQELFIHNAPGAVGRLPWRGARAGGGFPLFAVAWRALRLTLCLPFMLTGALLAFGALYFGVMAKLLLVIADLIRAPHQQAKPTANNVVDLDHERANRIPIGPLSPGNDCRRTDTDGGDVA